MAIRKIKYRLAGKVRTQAAAQQTGAFAFTAQHNQNISLAGFAEKDEVSPTTVDVTNPGGAGIDYGLFCSYTPAGSLAFVITTNGNGSAKTNLYGFDKLPDGSFIVCGTSAVTNTTVTFKDKDAATLATVIKPAGTGKTWSFWAKFSAAGAHEWSHSTQWSSTPTDTSYMDNSLQNIKVIGGRIYMAGTMRTVRNGASPAIGTVYGGLAYPTKVTLAQHIRSAFILEIDPATGNGLNIVVNDNFDVTTSNTVWTRVQADSLASYIVEDPDGEHLHFSCQYNGRRDSDGGYVNIGRNKVGTFKTRIFTTDGAGDAEQPYLAKYTLELEPVQCITVAQDDVLTGATSSRSHPGSPVVSDSRVYWTWATPGLGAGSTANLNRNPTAYGSNAPNVYGLLGRVNILGIPKSDYGDPRNTGNFSLGFADNIIGSNGYAYQGNCSLNANKGKLLTLARSYGGSDSNTTSFVGTAAIPFASKQSVLVGMDAITGGFLWRARIANSDSVASKARGLHAKQFASGPHANKTHILTQFEYTSLHTSVGARNASDDALAYNITNTWVQKSGTQAAYIMLVYDDSGEVLVDDCYPIFHTTVSITGVITEFNIF